MRVIATYSCTQATSELQLATTQAMNADGRAPLELYMHAQNTTKYIKCIPVSIRWVMGY